MWYAVNSHRSEITPFHSSLWSYFSNLWCRRGQSDFRRIPSDRSWLTRLQQPQLRLGHSRMKGNESSTRLTRILCSYGDINLWWSIGRAEKTTPWCNTNTWFLNLPIVSCWNLFIILSENHGITLTVEASVAHYTETYANNNTKYCPDKHRV